MDQSTNSAQLLAAIEQLQTSGSPEAMESFVAELKKASFYVVILVSSQEPQLVTFADQQERPLLALFTDVEAVNTFKSHCDLSESFELMQKTASEAFAFAVEDSFYGVLLNPNSLSLEIVGDDFDLLSIALSEPSESESQES